MDNILRRPMFRGGRVENRGTGITSALGYADGGRIGFNVGGYPPLVGSSYGKDFTMTRLPARTAGVPMVIPQAATTGRELMVIPQSGSMGGGTTGGNLLRGGSSLARYLTPTFAPTIGIASLLNPETEEEQKAIADLEEGTGMSGEAIDPELYNLLSTEVGKTRAAEDRVFSKGSTGVLERIYNTLNPTTSEINRRLQERATEKPLVDIISNYLTDIRKPASAADLTYRNEEEKQAAIAKEKLIEKIKNENEANVADKINKITTDTTTVEVPEKSNRDVMNEYMDMFKSVLGSDQDELTRQKYLELAKFGTNLLAQGGGKRSTLEKIGAAGTQSIEGLSKIAAQERASDKQIKLAGLQAALKEMDPGTVGKAVNDLKKLVPRERGESIKDYNQRITSMAIETGTGAATRAKVESDKFERLSNNLVTSEIVGDEISGDRAAETIKRYKISLNDLGQDATTAKQDKKYYIKKDGTIYRYDAKKNSGILPGEPGF
jgi:hypothetical protein